MGKNSAASIALQLQNLANISTEKTFDYNTKEANAARTWQTEMSNTSHQREVEDLKKAGLNPVLSSGGQGAQSYTTSSASAQASDPTSAVGNVWSSQIGADATRAAAAQNARAMRYAAAAQASAAKYAADMHYQSTKYAWDAKSKQIDQTYKNQLKLNLKSDPKNLTGLIWRASERSGFNDSIFTGKIVNNANKALKSFNANPIAFFKQQHDANVNMKNFVLNSHGVKTVNSYLKNLGISANSKNRANFVKGFIFQDYGAITSLLNLLPKRSNSARPKRSGIQI